jgi:S1-C subfamily serine protease
MKRFFLSLAMVVLLTFSSTVSVVTADVDKLVRSVFPLSIQEGESFRNICTASRVGKNAPYWLTAAHCVDAPEDIQVFLNSEVPIEVVEFDRTNDIAIFRADKKVPALKLAGKAPKVGDEVIVTGFPLGSVHRMTTFGRVSSTLFAIPGDVENGEAQWLFYMMFNVTVAPGNSGSAILNKRGEVVGVTQIAYGRGFSPIMGGSLFEILEKYRAYWQ